MKVFNACLKVIRGKIATLSINVIVFSVLLTILSSFSSQTQETIFAEEKPNFTIINRDEQSPMVEGLHKMLEEKAKEVFLEDEKEIIMDAVFFQATDYVLIVQEGFTEKFLSGEDIKLEKLLPIDATNILLLDSYIDRYLNMFGLYRDVFPDMSESEISEMAFSRATSSVDVEMKSFGEGKPLSTKLFTSFLVLLYPVLAFCISAISNIFMSFEKPELRMRNLASPISQKSQNLQKGFACFLVCVVFLMILLGVIFALNYSDIVTVDIKTIGLLFLNSFCLLLSAVSISILCSIFIKNDSVQNAVSNLVSLGMSFLCGAFLPLEFIQESVIRFSRFLPGYWYVKNVYNISELTHFTSENLEPIWTAFLIQLLFAVAFAAVALALARAFSQSQKAYKRTRTQRT